MKKDGSDEKVAFARFDVLAVDRKGYRGACPR